MVTLLNKLTAASLGLAALAFATGAQAAVVCNGDGDCWHAREAYTYPPAAGIVVHPDNWAWTGEKYRWHEHEGRGYWHNRAWVEF
jgi:hypothetical protein